MARFNKDILQSITILCGLIFGYAHNSKSSKKPNIPGPSHLTDKIAIVGAGASGIHMAYLLKKKGFKNIKIFEASGRVGGKCYTFNIKGDAVELGAVFLANNTNTRALLSDIGMKFGPKAPLEIVWLDGNREEPFKKFVIQSVMQYLKTANRQLAIKTLKKAIKKFNAIHLKLFGKYKGSVIPRPSKHTLWEARGTFLEFLERNNLLVLKDILSETTTSFGYGQIDEIPAIYWLILLKGYPRQNLHVPPTGMQKIWEKAVSHSKLHVVYDAKVVKLKRSIHKGKRKFLLIYRKKGKTGASSYGKETADFVIWTPEMKTSLNAMSATKQEQRVFSRTTNYYFTTFPINSINIPPSSSPLLFNFEAMQRKQYDSIWAIYDSYRAQHGYHTIKSNKYNQSPHFVTVYLLNTKNPNKRVCNTKAKYDHDKFEKIQKLRKVKVWRYFPHYSCKDVEKGILWDIIDMQGKEGIWYLGSSVYVETMYNVVDYNAFLIESLIKPK